MLAVVILGAVVRFSTLGVQSFWADEATTYGIVAHHGLGHVLSTVPGSESTPPLYYILLWLWSQLFGVSEIGLRSLSALIGTLTVPLMWLLGRKLVSARVGLVAALVTAVNPLLFWYSQEARTYSLLVFTSALSMLVLLWALEKPGPRRLLVWGCSAALALNTHYFAAFLVAGEAIWLGVALARSRRISAARVAAALAPIAISAAWLLPLSIHQNDGRARYIATDTGSLPFRLAQLVKQDVVAYDEPAKALVSVIAVLLVLVALALAVRATSRRERDGAASAAALGAGGVLLATIVALVATDYVNTRNLLETWPALALALAAGLGAARAGRLGVATTTAVVVLSIICIVAVCTNPLFQRLDWRGVARAMGPITAPRAIVGDHNAYAAFTPYLSRYRPFTRGTPVEEVDVFAFPYRLAGAHESHPPVRPAIPPSLPGFRVAQVRETDSYTLIRYRAPTPVPVSADVLARLNLTPRGGIAVLAQQP